MAMTPNALISDLIQRVKYTPHELLAAELFIRHVAESLDWAAIESGTLPRDCHCKQYLLDCADALREEKKRLISAERNVKVSA